MKKLLMVFLVVMQSAFGMKSLPHDEREELTKQLYAAAVLNDTAEIGRLLAVGANIDSKDESGRTALVWAAEAGSEAACRFLIAAGADFHKYTWSTGITALKAAVFNGHDEISKLLIDNGAKWHRYAGDSALVRAVASGNERLCRSLLLAGTSPKIGEPNLFMNAISTGNVPILKMLMNAGCRPLGGYKANWLWAMREAARENHRGVCEVLVAHQAQVNDGLVTALLCLKRMSQNGDGCAQLLYSQRKSLLLPYLGLTQYVPLTWLLNQVQKIEMYGDRGIRLPIEYKRLYDLCPINCLNPALLNRLIPSAASAAGLGDGATESGWLSNCSIQ